MTRGVLAEANPEALKVMGVEDTQTILEDFSSRCCASVETDFVSELQFDEPRLLEITKSQRHICSAQVKVLMKSFSCLYPRVTIIYE